MKLSRRSFLSGASLSAIGGLLPTGVIGAIPSKPGLKPNVSSTAITSASPIPRSTLIGTTIEPGMFKNLALSLVSLQSSPGYAYPAILDENGYPKSSPSSSIFGLIKFPSSVTPSDQMVLKWNGTAKIQLMRGAPGFSLVSGSNFVVGSPALNLTVSGTNARVVFRIAAPIPAAVTFVFVAGGTFAGLSNVVLCKLSDEAAIDSAITPAQMFDDNYVAIYQALNCGVVRPMGCTNPNGGNVSQSRYLAPWRSSINLCSQRWAPGAWAGSATGTNNYTCASPPDAGRSYVDGEMIQLQFKNANTSTIVTVNSGGRGPVPLLRGNGGATAQALVVGSITANSLATLTYDAVLGAFMWQLDGQTPSLPYELQIAFANRINAHYWCNFSAYMDDASVASIATLVRNNLNPTLNAYFEYGNEIWNFSFPATAWSAAKGTALGFPTDNSRCVLGWYGLRVRQIMNLVTTAWSPRSLTQLKRVMAFQAFAPSVGTNMYRFQGTDLNGAIYPRYAAKGYGNYNSAPNRPIDYCDVLSYATYYSGAQCANFDQNYVRNGPHDIASLLAAADDYSSNVSIKMASALAFIENDIRAGTFSGSGIRGQQTLLALSSGIYPKWEALASQYGKLVECYEGGHESSYPSIRTCSTLGIDPSYGGPTGKIAALLNAFKYSDAFRNVVLDQFSQFMKQPHSQTHAWLLLPGPNQWALSTSDRYAPKYKSWDAIVGLNH